jgi:hypothetical protein
MEYWQRILATPTWAAASISTGRWGGSCTGVRLGRPGVVFFLDGFLFRALGRWRRSLGAALAQVRNQRRISGWPHKRLHSAGAVRAWGLAEMWIEDRRRQIVLVEVSRSPPGPEIVTASLTLA